MHVKQDVDIGWFDLRKINKMLQQPFMAYILIVHQGVAIPHICFFVLIYKINMITINKTKIITSIIMEA
jgi:hypothetical protein